ncbi:MAG TPA: ATP-binding protein [Planctomycetota bacterium]|nr:ATP-binding protein [Planctomycetota bacterium]
MNSDGLKYVLRDFVGRPLPAGLPRELQLPIDGHKVIGLSGVRRSGKTFLFFDAMRRLVEQGVDRRAMLYLNFEDDRLHPLAAPDLDLVLRCHRELFPEVEGRLYLFLDEVQNAPGWERWVRRLHDTEQLSIFVTGSSSRVLTRDLSSAMRGRSVTLEVFPLSFREFLAFRRIDLVAFDARQESLVRNAFVDYLHQGGFPEVVLADASMRPLILEEYASVMLVRDLGERVGIRNEGLMRALLRHCFRNTSTLVNISKLDRDFRSLGLEFGKATLFEYMRLLEEAGLVFLLPVHEPSVRKQARNPKKLHVIDTGLVAAFLPGATRDVGHKLETCVFLECRRRSRQWHYMPGLGEIDLVDAEGLTLVNSCWNLTEPSTIEREAQAMAAAAEQLPGAEGRLLYHEHGADVDQRFPGAMPAWRWLLGG